MFPPTWPKSGAGLSSVYEDFFWAKTINFEDCGCHNTSITIELMYFLAQCDCCGTSDVPTKRAGITIMSLLNINLNVLCTSGPLNYRHVNNTGGDNYTWKQTGEE